MKPAILHRKLLDKGRGWGLRGEHHAVFQDFLSG